MNELDIASRLKAAREKCGKTPNQIIASVGNSFNSYYDLESGKDWFNAITLRNIYLISQAVALTPGELLLGRPNEPAGCITFEALRDRLVDWLRERNVTLKDLETRAGCELTSFIKDPASAGAWNLDRLCSVCEVISVDWRNVSFCLENSKRHLKAMSAKALARDVAILLGLTLAGGVISVAISAGQSPAFHRIADDISGIACILIGFTVAGCLVGADRIGHLSTVATILWITDVISLPLFHMSVEWWLLQLPFNFMFAGIGGAISYIFRR